MSFRLKVSGHEHLERDTKSNAIINTNVTEYQTYLKRVKLREKQSDELRGVVQEINTLKTEMREIKELIKQLGARK